MVLIASIVWAAILVIGAVIAFAMRTGPEEAIKNLSKWFEGVGVEKPDEWLTGQWRRRKVRVVIAAAFGLLFLVGVFTAGMVAGERLATGTPSIPIRPASHWPPLSTNETVALRDELRKLPAEKLSVLCAIPACAELAESIYDLSRSMNWPGDYSSLYFMDEGIRDGIEIWSYPSRERQRDAIASALERATNGRLRVSSRLWQMDSATNDPHNINLVIGRLKR